MSAGAPDKRTILKDALRAISELQEQLAAAERARHEPIAIIGMGCRFPGGVNGPDDFWRLLEAGTDAIQEVPTSRWTPEDLAALDPGARGGSPRQYGGFVDGIDRFDPHFFGIAPREAASMDPQHRMVLEVCWEALERAGQAPDTLRGSLTGVFVGITSSDYATHLRTTDPSRLDVYSANGNVHNSAPGRVSYLLGLQGPSMAIDTACSASLSAVHLACQSLRLGESDMALAGGVNALLVPDAFVSFGTGMLATDGRCKTFDERADGFVRAEGCGIVALKRLSDAEAAGDTVLAVIRGSAVNQDGPSSGLTVPNGPAQEAVLRKALSVAGVRPGAVHYVEAHGTGTSLGDPIELEALDAVMSEGRAPGAALVVGSVKTNVGHLEAASGIAGLIKVVLALQHQQIPANLHFRRLNPAITLRRLAVDVPTRALPWPGGTGERVAGVSSFGLSGTNAHVVVAETPAAAESPKLQPRPVHLVAISGKSAADVGRIARSWREELAAAPAVELADVARSSTRGRSHFDHRAAMVVASVAELDEQLARVAEGRSGAGVSLGEKAGNGAHPIAFLFTGQGSQYFGMGRELYLSQPVFRDVLDRCDRFLTPLLDRSLLSVMHSSPDAGLIDQTVYSQPALFAVEYALAEMWRAWGIAPDAVLGHSVGEYVAACVAGVFELEDALALVAARGRLMQALPAGGAMTALLCDEARVLAALRTQGGAAGIAAVNGPDNVVISGTREAVMAATAALEREGVSARPLTVSHAFHSALMDPMLGEFAQVAARVRANAPRIALISNVTGQPLGADEIPGAEYWCRHVREAVRFSDGMRSLHDLGYRIFLEAGPAPVLIGMGRRVVPKEGTTWLPTLRRERGEWQEVLSALGRLYTLGADVAWREVNRATSGRQIALPTYPFARDRYWVDPPANAASAAPTGGHRAGLAPEAHPLLGAPLRAAVSQTLFEQEVGSDRPAFLADHVVHGEVAFPATAFIEMALAGAATLWPGRPVLVEDFVISAPLFLPAGKRLLLQTVLTPTAVAETAVEVFSAPGGLNGGSSPWTAHASARLVPGSVDRGNRPARSLEVVQRTCASAVPVDALYEEHRVRGLVYGPAFRGLKEVWSGPSEALGLLQSPPGLAADAGRYLVHPAVLDACFQLLGAAAPVQSGGMETYVPVGVERIRYIPGGPPLWGHVEVQVRPDPASEELRADVTLFDEAGVPVAELAGLRLRRGSEDVLRGRQTPAFDEWLYDLQWRPISEPADEPAESRADGTWVLLSDNAGTGARLADEIMRSGGHVIVEPAAAADVERWPDAQCVAYFADVCRRAASEADGRLKGFVHLRGLDSSVSEGEVDAADRDLRPGTRTLLHLAQGLLQAGCGSTHIWVVTRGAQPVPPVRVVDPVQAAAAALARTVSAEHPQLQCVCVDLDPEPDAEGREIERLWRAIARPAGEPHIAVRAGRTHVARLVESQVRGRSGAEPPAVALETSGRGVLDNLHLSPSARTAPGPEQVEVRVTHAGLNFRDVLNALGMYPGDPGPLGAECVGTVAAVGPGVEHLKVGDPVVGMAGGGLRSYVTTTAWLLAVKPAALSNEEAATIPIAFLTAEYGLNRLARLQPGERVLIHAAAGGVGLAAVQIAKRAGAEIFATAGSPEKRARLHAAGIEHVLDSRSLDFSDEILRRTGGQGVHVVLNSLAGEFIGKTVAAVARGGRFVEIGKSGIWSDEQMSAGRPDIAYFPVYLGDVEPPLIHEMLTSLLARIAEGELEPLPLRMYPIEEAVSAFRFMAQARHIGKIVLSLGQPEGARIRPDGTYLVTGAFGGLGQAVAAWLARQGARRLVLVGRTGATTPAAIAAVADLRNAGVDVISLAADIGNDADAARVFRDLQDGPALRGIVHAAGVLDDGLVEELTWERFERVFVPKVRGSWNLHHHTRDLPLDFFVFFSSASAVIGTPGQGNYACANAFMDALAHHRQAVRLPATSLNWGPWEGLGMAQGLSAQARQRWNRLGIGLIDTRQGLEVLERALGAGLPQLGVFPVDWRRLAASLTGESAARVFSELTGASGDVRGGVPMPISRPALRERLEHVPEKGRRVAIQAHVREVVRQVLGVDSSFPLESSQGLRQLGMDSLMAVELRNHLQAATGLTLASTIAFDRPTISALAAYIEERLSPAPSAVKVSAGVTELEGMSDEDAEALLARELAQ